MGKELRDTIKDITHRHLKKFKSQVFGQNLTGVGWVRYASKLFEKMVLSNYRWLTLLEEEL